MCKISFNWFKQKQVALFNTNRKGAIKMNKKKAIISIAGVLAIVSLGSFIFLKQDTQVVSKEKEKVELNTQEPKVVNESTEEKVSYEGIGGLEYQLASKEIGQLKDGGYSLTLDIISAVYLSKEQLTVLEQEAFNVAKKESGKEIEKVIIHVVQSADEYEAVKADGFKGGNGLFATVYGDHANTSPVVTATHFKHLIVPELKEREIGENEDPFAEDDGNIDAFEYDVVNSSLEGDKLTLDIIGIGKSEEVASFIIGFVQVHRDLNPSAKTFALNIYESSDSYSSKTPKWQYDGQILTYEELLNITQE